jgi:hypothetical protein
MPQGLWCFLLIKVKEMSQIFHFSRILTLRRSEHAKPRKKDVAWLRKRNGLAGWKKRGSGELRRSGPARLRKSAYTTSRNKHLLR